MTTLATIATILFLAALYMIGYLIGLRTAAKLVAELPPPARDIHYRVLWLKDRQVQLVSEIERMPQAQRDRLRREVQRLEFERQSLNEECERLDARLREG